MIYVLPGMGANQRMYSGVWRELQDAVFLDWPASTDETISTLARRVVDEARIPDGAVIAGSSLGGIVACEIAALRRVERLFLFGSATRKEEVNRLLRLVNPLVGVVPLSVVQRSCAKLPSDVLAMFGESDPVFIRNMCRAIFTWEGLKQPAVPVHRVHGTRDLVIAAPPDAELLLDAGHLIAMTHAAECVRFVETKLSARRSNWRDETL